MFGTDDSLGNRLTKAQGLTYLQVLLDLERIDQVSEAVFKQDGKDMAIPLYMAVCLAGYANLADIYSSA